MYLKNPFFKGLLFRLTSLNMIIITLAIIISSFAIYQTACFLVESIGGLNQEAQSRFESLLFQYLLLFSILTIIIGAVLHFYLTRNLIRPIRQIIQSTKKLKEGEYPSPVDYQSSNEIGELIGQYNELIRQLESNDSVRKKMISDLSHEIRTPISNLNGYLYALKNGDIDSNTEILESLYLETQRLKQLLEHLNQLKEWDYSSSQTILTKQFVDISKLIEQCILVFQWSFEQAQLPIKKELSSRQIYIQKEGIQQVINNLLDNALRYHESDSPIMLKGESLNEVYRVSVVSQGNPIPLEEQEKIFNRFYRLDPSRSRETGGSGLGLSIAKEIIEKHDGQIGVEVENNQNNFWFILPINKKQ